MLYITRRERFSSAHKLFNPEFSQEENFEIFGQCSNPNWHGHNYEIFVTVKGEVSPSTGFVMNIKKLSSILREKVIKKIDHKNLNTDVDFLKNVNPTSENIAIAVWNEIEYDISLEGAMLHKIKLIETENNFVEYYG